MNPNFETLINKQEPLHEDLVPYLENNGYDMIRHPLVFSVPHVDSFNALINYRYLFNKEKLEQYIDAQKFERIISIHERPYRLHAFVTYVRDHCTTREYWELLRFIYTDSESIHYDHDLWEEVLFYDAPPADAQYFMNSKDNKQLAKMPETINIYRGVHGSEWQGFSWTLSLEKAKWFAHRFKSTGDDVMVVSGKIKKHHVLGYMSTRGEQEIVCHYYNVYDVKII